MVLALGGLAGLRQGFVPFDSTIENGESISIIVFGSNVKNTGRTFKTEAAFHRYCSARIQYFYAYMYTEKWFDLK